MSGLATRLGCWRRRRADRTALGFSVTLTVERGGPDAGKWDGMAVLVSRRKADVPDEQCRYPARCVTGQCSGCGRDVHHDPAQRILGPFVIVCEPCVGDAVARGDLPSREDW